MTVHCLSRCGYKKKDTKGLVAWAELRGGCVSARECMCLRNEN